MELKPNRGGSRPEIGCGGFTRDSLLGLGPADSKIIDPVRGATQSDLRASYKEAKARASALERTERIVSRKVLAGHDVSDDQLYDIYQRELKRTPPKFTHMRYHSYLVYFGMLKRLHWVEPTGETEPSSLQDAYPDGPDRVYYRITQKGKDATPDQWANPQAVLYPQFGPNHSKKA